MGTEQQVEIFLCLLRKVNWAGFMLVVSEDERTCLTFSVPLTETIYKLWRTLLLCAVYPCVSQEIVPEGKLNCGVKVRLICN